MQATRVAWSQETGCYRAAKRADDEIRLKPVDRLLRWESQHSGSGGGERVLTRDEWESRVRAYAGLPPADKPN